MDVKGARALVERLQQEQQRHAAREEILSERAPDAYELPESDAEHTADSQAA
jgi:hypothetical protein